MSLFHNTDALGIKTEDIIARGDAELTFTIMEIETISPYD